MVGVTALVPGYVRYCLKLHHVEKRPLDLSYLQRANSHQTLPSEDLTTDIYNLAALLA